MLSSSPAFESSPDNLNSLLSEDHNAFLIPHSSFLIPHSSFPVWKWLITLMLMHIIWLPFSPILNQSPHHLTILDIHKICPASECQVLRVIPSVCGEYPSFHFSSCSISTSLSPPSALIDFFQLPILDIAMNYEFLQCKIVYLFFPTSDLINPPVDRPNLDIPRHSSSSECRILRRISSFLNDSENIRRPYLKFIDPSRFAIRDRSIGRSTF
jgi:hypothetical protein